MQHYDKVEFNEYCQVLEIQGLGKCMLKMFIQMMSILESMFRSSFRCEQNENHNIQQCQHSGKKTKRAQVNRQHTTRKMTKATVTYADTNNKHYFAQKQKNKFEVKQMEEQLNKVQKKYIEKDQDSNIYYFDDHKIKLSKQRAITLEPSNAQFMITEACVLIESKYNSFLDLMDIRNKKIKMLQPKDYKKFQQNLFNQIQSQHGKNYNEAVKKLLVVVQKYYNNKQTQKMLKMKHQQSQTIKQQPVVLTISKQDKQKQMKKDEEIKHLKQELKQQRIKNQSLQRLLKQKSDNFEKELLKQRATVMKLEQRVSIASKFSHRQSQFALDFVTSQQSFLKQQQSQKQLRSSSKLLQRKVYDRKSSRLRPSYDRMQKALDDVADRGSVRRTNQKSIILSCYSNVYQLIMHPGPRMIENSLYLSGMTQCDAGVQTQKQKQTYKQKAKVQKIVKFKTQFKIIQQFQIQIGSFMKRQEIIIKQFQGLNNTNFPVSSYTKLLKKKKNINWSKGKHLKTVEQSIQQDQMHLNPRRSYSKADFNKQNFKDLFVGAKSELSDDSEKDMFKKLKQFKLKTKTKVPDILSLAFNQSDLQNLFLDSERASDFQFLNYNMGSYKTRHDSIDILKSQKFNNISQLNQKNKKYLSQHYPSSSSTGKIFNQNSNTQYFVQTLFKHISFIKNSSAQKHEKIRNFLRFPHSSIHKSTQQKWKVFSKQQQQIGLNQMRKIFARLQKIHAGCAKINGIKICDHMCKFLTKIGIMVQAQQFL